MSSDGQALSRADKSLSMLIRHVMILMMMMVF